MFNYGVDVTKGIKMEMLELTCQLKMFNIKINSSLFAFNTWQNTLFIKQLFLKLLALLIL